MLRFEGARVLYHLFVKYVTHMEKSGGYESGKQSLYQSECPCAFYVLEQDRQVRSTASHVCAVREW